MQKTIAALVIGAILGALITYFAVAGGGTDLQGKSNELLILPNETIEVQLPPKDTTEALPLNDKDYDPGIKSLPVSAPDPK